MNVVVKGALSGSHEALFLLYVIKCGLCCPPPAVVSADMDIVSVSFAQSCIFRLHLSHRSPHVQTKWLLFGLLHIVV